MTGYLFIVSPVKRTVVVTNAYDMTFERSQNEFCEKKDKKISFYDFLEQEGLNPFKQKIHKNYEVANSEYWTQSSFKWENELKKTNFEVFGHRSFRMNQVNPIFYLNSIH